MAFGLDDILGLGMLGYSAFGGGNNINTSNVTSSADVEQRGLLSQLAYMARFGRPSAHGAPGLLQGADPGPSAFTGLTPLQQRGIGQLGNLPLGQAQATAGAGAQTLGRMLDPTQNMEFAQQLFQPQQDFLANRFASHFGDESQARSSGFGQALGRGFAQGVMPQVFAQQGQALSQVPQMAGLPMGLQGQAAQGALAAGGLQRQVGTEQLLDELRRFDLARPENNPMLRLGLQASGIPVGTTVAAPQMTPAAMVGMLASSPGVWDFLGGLGGGAGGGSDRYSGANLGSLLG